MKIFKRGLTYDDVSIIPQYSSINSRSDIDITSELHEKLILKAPIISANMDTVTEDVMCETMHNVGGFGILHRFASDEKTLDWVYKLREKHINFGVSIGVNRSDERLLKLLVAAGVDVICVDVAHGHHEKVKRRIDYIRGLRDGLIIIAGNVCTFEGARFLAEAGADVIKTGVGGGSICMTRLATGCGVPQLTAVGETVKIKEGGYFPNVKIIADGGIKNPADVVKALAIGADAVMIGGLLAGTKAAPGEIVTWGSFRHPVIYKNYRGSASMRCKVDNKQDARYIEGVSTLVPYRGKVESVIYPIIDGLRSGMSYVGAETLAELRKRVKWMSVSSHGYHEGTPHGCDPGAAY